MEMHRFHPNGDVLLILSARLGSCDGSESQTASIETKDKNKKSEKEKKRKRESSATPPQPAEFATQSRMELLVSSYHLVLISPVFEKMLEHGNFKEGKELQENKYVEIALPEDNPEAFIILMNIVHGQAQKVPREVDLDMLTNLAILVDKYEMLEVADIYSEVWIKNYWKSYPEVSQVYGNRSIILLFITWAFKRGNEFKTISGVIERECTEDFREIVETQHPELPPIPECVISTIEEHRIQGIVRCFQLLADTIESYQSGSSMRCPKLSYGGSTKHQICCDSLMLGSLIRSATAMELWPIPAHPYDDLSFDSVKSAILRLKPMSLCDYTSGQYESRSAHGLMQGIEGALDHHEQSVCGLCLKSLQYPKHRKSSKRHRAS